MAISDSEWLKIKEIVEVLAGMRGDKRRAAIRAGEIDPQAITVAVRQLKEAASTLADAAGEIATPAPSQGEISAPPTAGDFNGLVNDIQALHQQIESLINALSG